MGTMEEQEEADEVGFEDLGLDPCVLRAIAKLGLSKPTPIQLKTIPLILEGKDVVARAKTGSGKTLAYLLPLIHKGLHANAGGRASPSFMSLVLVPTRELCQQVHSVVLSLLEYCGTAWKAVQLTSGMSSATLRSALSGDPNVIVSTPACFAMCIAEKIIQGSTLQERLSALVLDEADLLLSYGYDEDLHNLATHIPHKCQCLLMSATSSADVEKLKKLVLHNPITLTLMDVEGDASEAIVPKTVQQFSITCKAEDKLIYILALLRLELVQKNALIFVNTIEAGFRIKLFLEQFSIKTAVLNAELPQNSRLHILQEFNIGLFDYLIATDDGKSTKLDDYLSYKASASESTGRKSGGSLKKGHRKALSDTEFGVVRGIDFKNVQTVINFDMPGTPSGYIHRIGRTGRARNTGASVSLVSPEEEELLNAVQRIFNGGCENPTMKHITPFPLLTKNAIESLRYRAEDVARSVTKVAIREARAKELRMEILNSERLKAHFEDNPKDLELLKHDKVLSKNQSLSHLKVLPEYLRDPTTEAASKSVKLARAAMGQTQSGLYARLWKKRTRKDDPLKTFSAQPKQAKSASNKGRNREWQQNNKKRTAKGKASHHHKKKARRHR